MSNKEISILEVKLIKFNVNFINLLKSYRAIRYEDIEFNRPYKEEELYRNYKDYKKIKELFNEFLNIDLYEFLDAVRKENQTKE